VQVPEEWPWEEAKKVFEKPDVTPASELEVSFLAREFLFI
jgi:flap endonuclease-1